MIAGLSDAAAAAAAGPAVAARLAELDLALRAAPWPAGAADEIDAALAAAGLADAALAVRSSATAEDAPAHSFAGIHDSTLSVRGAPAVRAAISACFASLWTPRALVYRRHRGLSDDAVACAVALCEMVAPARAAGVAFTCDPETGNRGLLRVSAVAGLGDALVAGRVAPHESVVASAGPLTAVLEHAPASPLSRGQLHELADLALRVQWACGDGQDPQDIEWVHDGARFWLVQARPVVNPRDPRPAHLRAFPIMWSNANIKDAVPVVLTQLAWSMVKPAIDGLLFHALSVSGYPVPPGLATLRRFGGRGYFDLTLMQGLLHDGLGVEPREVNRTMGGLQPELPVPPLRARPWRERLACVRRLLRFVARLRRLDGEVDPAIARHRAEVAALSRADPATLSLEHIARDLFLLGESATRFQPTFMLASTAAGGWFQALQDNLKAALGEDGLDLAGALLAGSGAVTSANHGYAVADLARLAAAEPAARAYLEAPDRDPAGWRALPGDSPFRARFQAFLDEFGHRAVYEADIANPRWAEDPTFVLEQVKAALALPGGGVDPALATRRRAEEGLARLAWWRRPLLRWFARKAARGAAHREASKSAMALALLPSRRLVLEVGRRMVGAGLIDRVEDVFALAVLELRAWMAGAWDGRGARELVADRTAQRARWLATRPPDCFTTNEAGEPVPLEPGQPLPPGLRAAAPMATSPAPDGWIACMPLSSGVATGRARLVRHPDEGHRLEMGEVLVAPSTDPAWTPCFLRASAIVMETGGILSHGAIVAREYGLPAVANIPRLFERLQDGQQVTVDGGRGRISVAES